MNESVTQWKQKYYDSLDELERREKQWQDLEEVFKQAISRLSLVAEGNSKNLDTELRQLRTALRKGKDNRVIRGILESVTEEIIKLDKQMQSGPVGDAGFLLKIIEQMSFSGKTEKKARKLIKVLKARQPPKQQELIKLFSDLLADVVRQAIDDVQKNKPGTSGSGKAGFLSGLFVRNNSAEEEKQAVKSDISEVAETNDKQDTITGQSLGLEQEQEQLTSVVATVQNVLESIIDGLDITDDVKDQLKDKVFAVKPTREIHVLLDDLRGILKGAGVVEEDCNELLSEVSQHHELLIRLLEFLPLEDSVKDKAEALKNDFQLG